MKNNFEKKFTLEFFDGEKYYLGEEVMADTKQEAELICRKVFNDRNNDLILVFCKEHFIH